MTDCKLKINKGRCPCTFTSCGRHGVCCDCLDYHLSQKQLPACAFPPDVAGTSQRSIEKFTDLYQQRNGSWL